MVSERCLQLYWLHNVRRGTRLRLTDGREAVVVSPGIFNKDAGPDFRFARLRVGDTLLAGDVEMHLRASDWHRHGHSSDAAFGSVVLHVVCEADSEVEGAGGNPLPEVLMCVPAAFADYVEMLGSQGEPYMRCGDTPDFLASMSDLHRADWLETQLHERMGERVGRVMALHKRLRGDWRHTLFAMLARALGFGVNSDAMEMLGSSLPLNALERHSSSRFQLEALLLGQAGLLAENAETAAVDYERRLAAEYAFLRHKYGLVGLDRVIWKMARTRPANFPYRRIALLAAFCEGGFGLFGQMLDCSDRVESLTDLMGGEPSEFWQGHSSFRESSASGAARHRLTLANRRLVVLNAFVPVLAAYGMQSGKTRYTDDAERLLRQLPAEGYALIRQWQARGIVAKTAADSQALLHLYRTYCSQNRCLECRWGSRLLRQNAKNGD